jgi:hypothetical protein
VLDWAGVIELTKRPIQRGADRAEAAMHVGHQR